MRFETDFGPERKNYYDGVDVTLKIDETDLAAYQYLGLSTIVTEDGVRRGALVG